MKRITSYCKEMSRIWITWRHFCFRYQSGDQTPGSETGGPTGGPAVQPGDLDVKAQILQQQELQKQASAAAKTKGNSAPTSPMKDGKKASFFGKGYIQH